MTKKNTFAKKEHLCSKKNIDLLFNVGKAFLCYPLRIVYSKRSDEDDVSVRVLIVVPKKKIKLACQRNRLKRLIRESYRINKHEVTELLEQKNMRIDLAFQYVSDEMQSFQKIERKVQLALKKIQDEINF